MSAPEIDLTRMVFEVNVYGEERPDRVKRIVLTPTQRIVKAVPGATIEFRVSKVIREEEEVEVDAEDALLQDPEYVAWLNTLPDEFLSANPDTMRRAFEATRSGDGDSQ